MPKTGSATMKMLLREVSRWYYDLCHKIFLKPVVNWNPGWIVSISPTTFWRPMRRITHTLQHLKSKYRKRNYLEIEVWLHVLYLQAWLVQQLVHFPRPLIYKQGVHFINFSWFGDFMQPSYFGVVRSPLERFRSRFNFVRNKRWFLPSKTTVQKMWQQKKCA